MKIQTDASPLFPRSSVRACLNSLAASAVLGLPAIAADITFFAYSDCHIGAGDPPKRSTPVVDWINALPGTAYPEPIGGKVAAPLAVIMSGDLIDHGSHPDKYQGEWDDYIADFGVNGEGRCKFRVFEGMGNHDWNPNLFVYGKIRERNVRRLELGLIQQVSDNGYHYSWDWEGIHFVNLNIFPGNGWFGEADPYNSGAHDPMFSRDFLEKDLRKNIGDSGRPVILIHHFRPIDENWWTYSAADQYQRIIQDYNVIVIMVGHQGGGVDNRWRGISWASSNGELEVFRITPDNILTAIARKADRWERPMRKKIHLDYPTSGLPAAVNNGEWATGVTSQSAVLHGRMLYDATPASEATIYWGPQDGGDQPGLWANSVKPGHCKTGVPFKTEISGLKPWTPYFYRTRVANAKGEAWAAASIPFVTRGTLPEKWDTAFIGYEQRPWGGANLEDNVITVRGSGRDIGEPGQKIDNFQYAFTKVGKDPVIQARLLGMEGNTRQPMAGVMLRENLEAGSRSVALLQSKQGLRLFSRPESNDKTNLSPVITCGGPVQLKLERHGNTFTGYASPDGNQWIQVGKPVTVEMGDSITAGLAVTAGNRDGSRHQEAKFDGITVK